MKNQISHDSIHRVEPSARFLAEQRNKIDVDLQSTQKAAELENLEKETRPLDTESTGAPDNEKEGNSPRQAHQVTPRGEKKPEKPAVSNHHMGGQLFDSQA